jgi:hypothetical protein
VSGADTCGCRPRWFAVRPVARARRGPTTLRPRETPLAETTQAPAAVETHACERSGDKRLTQRPGRAPGPARAHPTHEPQPKHLPYHGPCPGLCPPPCLVESPADPRPCAPLCAGHRIRAIPRYRPLQGMGRRSALAAAAGWARQAPRRRPVTRRQRVPTRPVAAPPSPPGPARGALSSRFPPWPRLFAARRVCANGGRRRPTAAAATSSAVRPSSVRMSFRADSGRASSARTAATRPCLQRAAAAAAVTAGPLPSERVIVVVVVVAAAAAAAAGRRTRDVLWAYQHPTRARPCRSRRAPPHSAAARRRRAVRDVAHRTA